MNVEFPCPGPISAELRMSAGTLEVVATERASATVVVEPMDNSDASAEAVKETKIDFKEGKHLLVSAPEHGGWRVFRRAKVRVRVQLPLDCTLTVRVASADAQCHGRYRDAVVHTASGDVNIEHITGDASVNSASGDVQIGRVERNMRVNSASGDIRAEHVGGSLVAHSASGDVEIGGVDADASVNTASGDVSVGVARSGQVKLHTASGDVAIGVAAGTGVWLDLNTMSGRTISDLAMTDGAPPATGTATLTIKARTASGDITLRRVSEQPA